MDSFDCISVIIGRGCMGRRLDTWADATRALLADSNVEERTLSSFC